MNVTTYDRAEPFLERAEAFLLAREAENGLPLAVACDVRSAAARAFFALVTGDDGQACAAAVWTPPHGLIVTDGPDEALRGLASRAHEQSSRLPGVVGPEAAVSVFSAAWQAATGCTATVKFEQRCYSATVLRVPASVPGALRLAELTDVPFVAQAIADFGREVGVGKTDLQGATQAATARIQAHDFYLWEDGEPVSVAALCRPTPAGIAVNAVFTPPERRGRGYAQACVAATSAVGLARGKRFVTLYADRNNPISNRVYLNIGYEPVIDVLQLDFT